MISGKKCRHLNRDEVDIENQVQEFKLSHLTSDRFLRHNPLTGRFAPSTSASRTNYPSRRCKTLVACYILHCQAWRLRGQAYAMSIASWVIQAIVNDLELPSFAIDVHAANQPNPAYHAMLIAALSAVWLVQLMRNAAYPKQYRRTISKHLRMVAAAVERCPTTGEGSTSHRANSD